MEEIDSYCTFQNQLTSDSEKKNQLILQEAIRRRNTDLVRHLIEGGTKANGYCISIPYHRPLHSAVISRSQEIVGLLLKAGANVNMKSQNGETPLTLAAKLGITPVIDLLLGQTVENDQDEFCLSHLHIACMRNKIDVARKLLLTNKFENVNNLDSAVAENSSCWAGYTPLHFAVYYGCIETVEFLLKCGADITVKDAREMTPLHLADFCRNEEIIDLILAEHKRDLRNPVNAQGLSHFHIACTRDDTSVVEHFLRSGVDVNLRVTSKPWTGWRAIHFATYYECPDVIKLLMHARIYLGDTKYSVLLKLIFLMGNETIYNLLSRTKDQFVTAHNRCEEMTNLLHACIQDDTSKMGMLLSCNKISAPSDFNTLIWTGCTPFHLAIQYRSAGILEFFLEYKASCMVQDSKGKTPLHIAFELSQFQVVNRMVNIFNDSIQNLTDHSGLSVFHILCSTDALDLIEKFVLQGVDINAQVGSESAYWAGASPIHFAIIFQKPEVVILLMKHHADISFRNGLGGSPLDLLTDGLDQRMFYKDDQRVISEMFMAIFSATKNIKELNYRAISPLHALCINKYTDLAVLHQHLILHPDEINKTTDIPNSCKSDRCSALHLALQRHHFDQAKLLLEKGADPLAVNSNGERPLECITSLLGRGCRVPDAEYLFRLSSPIKNFRPRIFQLACVLGLTNIVKYLLQNADEKMKLEFINSFDDNKQSPLHLLLRGNLDETPKKRITHLLLENGFNVNARDLYRVTPLQYAFYFSESFDVACSILSHGADVNDQDLYGRTSLHMITKSCGPSTKKKLILLLENGADINIMNERGQTCLVKILRWVEIESDPTGCYVILLHHICKLRVLGYCINHVNQEAYIKLLERSGESFDEADFLDKCKRELKSMIDINIDSCTTLYDILFKSPNQMIFHSNNVVLQTIVNTSEFIEKFLIYGYLIRLKLKNGKMREPLVMKFETAMTVLSRKSLPSVCLESISQYLSNTDLKNIILSTKKSKS